MVRAHHVILTYYGFWLPNDPRGSWSDFVGKFELYRYGPATRVHDVRSRASDPHDYRSRIDAKTALKYPPVRLDGLQARDVALGFAERPEEDGFRIMALTVLLKHTHVLIARTGRKIELSVNRLKSAATARLERHGRHPFQEHRNPDSSLPKLFARGCWKVFLNTDEAIIRAEDYTDENPRKEGLPRQTWSFVRPLRGR